MDHRILAIRISQESKQWDDMVNRLEQYLKEEQQKKIAERDHRTAQVKAEEEKKPQSTKNALQKLKSQTARKFDGEEQNDFDQQEANENVPKVYDPKKKDDELFNVEKLRELLETKHSFAQVFNAEEMKLISFAFKSQISEIKDALSNIDILRQKSKFENQKPCLDQYRQGLISDMIKKCKNQNSIVERHCIPVCGSLPPLIFFKKLQADNYKHMTTVTTDPLERGQYKKEALKHYQEAIYISDQLSLNNINNTSGDSPGGDTIDFLRLGLKLNYAIFWHDIMLHKKDAIRQLKVVLQEALYDIEKWAKGEEEMIKGQIELIQENINIWKEQVDTDSEEET